MEEGTESSTISRGTNKDSTSNVCERTTGELTALSFDKVERETTVTFAPSEEYSLDDVAETVENQAGDCCIPTSRMCSNSGASRT